ncbi:MAG TPA: hypothetical protein VKD22_09320 [Ramlibacter sp.]|nr:hypothetical protein [Ramlibacter sp.]
MEIDQTPHVGIITLGVKDHNRAKQFYSQVVKPAQRTLWAGYPGYYAGPDGYLWKVVTGSGNHSFAAEQSPEAPWSRLKK